MRRNWKRIVKKIRIVLQGIEIVAKREVRKYEANKKGEILIGAKKIMDG